MDNSWRWIAWLILGIGGLIVVGGLALAYGSLELVLYGERAPGVVTEIRREGDMYAPAFRFRLPSGEMHEARLWAAARRNSRLARPWPGTCLNEERHERTSVLHGAGAPTPVAPFSHAVEVDGWCFITGQMPTFPDDDARPLPPDIEGQTVG
jgi:hypothetical protein